MPSSSRHQFSAEPGAFQSQLHQQPNQGPATAPPHEPDLAPLKDEELDEAPPASEEPEPAGSSDSDDPPAGTTPIPGVDPLRAERRRSNQLEKELRKARAQLARFSEINPDEYARLQEAERKREEQERQWNLREQELNNANRRRVQAVEKERDESSSFFDTFCKLCGGQFRLGQSEGRERLEPIDAAGQPYALDGVALSAADHMEELRRHPVFSFLFQQRNGLYQSSAEGGYDSAGVPVNLQSMSTRELYMEAMRSTTPRVPARS
jgi:hypothetical protein